MKAYQIILQLLKHPTREVRMERDVEITDISYNRGFKEFSLWHRTNVRPIDSNENEKEYVCDKNIGGISYGKIH